MNHQPVFAIFCIIPSITFQEECLALQTLGFQEILALPEVMATKTTNKEMKARQKKMFGPQKMGRPRIVRKWSKKWVAPHL